MGRQVEGWIDAESCLVEGLMRDGVEFCLCHDSWLLRGPNVHPGLDMIAVPGGLFGGKFVNDLGCDGTCILGGRGRCFVGVGMWRVEHVSDLLLDHDVLECELVGPALAELIAGDSLRFRDTRF